MSDYLPDSPALIIQKLLITRGMGIDVSSSGDWKVYRANTPDTPDKIIVVFETEGVTQGRMYDQGYMHRKGIMLHVRSNDYDAGNLRARLIERDLCETITDSLPLIYLPQESYYRIHGIKKTSGPIPIGKELEASSRYVFSLNFTIALEYLQGYTP